MNVLDKLLSSVNNENLLLTHIRSLRLLQNITIFEYDYLMVDFAIKFRFLIFFRDLDDETMCNRCYSGTFSNV
jgi:hypothetical protein